MLISAFFAIIIGTVYLLGDMVDQEGVGDNKAYELGSSKNYLKCFKQGCKNFPVIHDPPQNSGFQEGDDVKQVPPHKV
jgi:hypothetical protein